MIEVLMLGLLVALVKLQHIATVVPGVAIWAFGAVMVLLAAAAVTFNPRAIWARLGNVQHDGDVSQAANANSTAATAARQLLHLSRLRLALEAACARAQRKLPAL